MYENAIASGKLRPNRNKLLYWIAIHHLSSYVFHAEARPEDTAPPPSTWEREQLLCRLIESSMDKVAPLPHLHSAVHGHPSIVPVWGCAELHSRRYVGKRPTGSSHATLERPASRAVLRQTRFPPAFNAVTLYIGAAPSGGVATGHTEYINTNRFFVWI